jgi:hypothetical protein
MRTFLNYRSLCRLFVVLILFYGMSLYAGWPDNPNTFILISASGDSAAQIQAISDHDGGVIVLWENLKTNILQQKEIRAQRLDKNGDVVWGEGGISVAVIENQNTWRFIHDGHQGVIIVWTVGFDGQIEEILGERISSDGQLMWQKKRMIDTAYPITSLGELDAVGNDNFLISYVADSDHYSDDFENSNAGNWQPLNPNRWVVQSDDQGSQAYLLQDTNYEPLSNDRLGEYSIFANDLPDGYQVDLKARSIEDVDANPEADYAIIFGYLDEQNYSFIQIKQDRAKIRSIVNNVATPWLGELDLTNVIENFNDYQHITLEQFGSMIILSINKEVDTFQDESYRIGKIGVGSWNDAAFFDDFHIGPSTRSRKFQRIAMDGSSLWNKPFLAEMYVTDPAGYIYSYFLKSEVLYDYGSLKRLCFTLNKWDPDGQIQLESEFCRDFTPWIVRPYSISGFVSNAYSIALLMAYDYPFYSSKIDANIFNFDLEFIREQDIIVTTWIDVEKLICTEKNYYFFIIGGEDFVEQSFIKCDNDMQRHYRYYYTSAYWFNFVAKEINFVSDIPDSTLVFAMDDSVHRLNVDGIDMWDPKGIALPLHVVGLVNNNSTSTIVMMEEYGVLYAHILTEDGTLGVQGKVATPFFDPQPGTYSTPQYIQIKCPTPDVDFYYTTDGSDPINDGQIYTDPIFIEQTTAIAARASKAGMTVSDLITGVFTITGTNVASQDLTENSTIPRSLGLDQNYPNPFNPVTHIRYHVPEHGQVVLGIYNLQGQYICSLVNQFMTPGHYSCIWNGRDSTGMLVSAGVYLVRLSTQNKNVTMKIVYAK